MRVFADENNELDELSPTIGCLLEQDVSDRRYCLLTKLGYGNPLCFVAPIEGVRMKVTTLLMRNAGKQRVGRVRGNKIVVVRTNVENGVKIREVPNGVMDPKDAFYYLSDDGSTVHFDVHGQRLALELSLSGDSLRVCFAHEGGRELLVAKLNRLAVLDPCFDDVENRRFTQGDVALTRFVDFGGLLDEVRRTSDIAKMDGWWPEVKMLMLNPKSDKLLA